MQLTCTDVSCSKAAYLHSTARARDQGPGGDARAAATARQHSSGPTRPAPEWPRRELMRDESPRGSRLTSGWLPPRRKLLLRRPGGLARSPGPAAARGAGSGGLRPAGRRASCRRRSAGWRRCRTRRSAAHGHPLRQADGERAPALEWNEGRSAKQEDSLGHGVRTLKAARPRAVGG